MQLRLLLQVFCNIQWWVFQDELSINRLVEFVKSCLMPKKKLTASRTISNSSKLTRFTLVNPIVKHPRQFTPSPIEVYWVYETSIWDDV